MHFQMNTVDFFSIMESKCHAVTSLQILEKPCIHTRKKLVLHFMLLKKCGTYALFSLSNPFLLLLTKYPFNLIPLVKELPLVSHITISTNSCIGVGPIGKSKGFYMDFVCPGNSSFLTTHPVI